MTFLHIQRSLNVCLNGRQLDSLICFCICSVAISQVTQPQENTIHLREKSSEKDNILTIIMKIVLTPHGALETRKPHFKDHYPKMAILSIYVCSFIWLFSPKQDHVHCSAFHLNSFPAAWIIKDDFFFFYCRSTDDYSLSLSWSEMLFHLLYWMLISLCIEF